MCPNSQEGCRNNDSSEDKEIDQELTISKPDIDQELTMTNKKVKVKNPKSTTAEPHHNNKSKSNQNPSSHDITGSAGLEEQDEQVDGKNGKTSCFVVSEALLKSAVTANGDAKSRCLSEQILVKKEAKNNGDGQEQDKVVVSQQVSLGSGHKDQLTQSSLHHSESEQQQAILGAGKSTY